MSHIRICAVINAAIYNVMDDTTNHNKKSCKPCRLITNRINHIRTCCNQHQCMLTNFVVIFCVMNDGTSQFASMELSQINKYKF